MKQEKTYDNRYAVLRHRRETLPNRWSSALRTLQRDMKLQQARSARQTRMSDFLNKNEAFTSVT